MRSKTFLQMAATTPAAPALAACSANGLAQRTDRAHRPVSSGRPDRHGAAHCA